MVRSIRKIIEKHPLTQSLRPHGPDQWASDRFTIKRPRELRDPSVMAAGVTTNITGCRADIIIYDDVEVPNTSDSQDKRESLRERLQESYFILSPGGTQLYIGTPHHYFSIYADTPREEIGEEEIFLAGFNRYEQPILDSNDNSVWPEQYSNQAIKQLERQSGPNKFASQMMLKPMNIMEGRLDHNLLNFYEDDLAYSEAQQKAQLHLLERKIISCAAWWDPSFGAVKGDASVLAVVFTDDAGHHYLHHIEYIKVSAQEGEDEATLQCHAVIEVIDKFYIPSIAIEANGIGKFLPSILRAELAKKNIACSVVEKYSAQNKALRILEGFDAVLAARALSVHDNIKQTPFLMEMMEWQPDKKNNRDDGLDAVAGALSLEPSRIKRFYTSVGKRWSANNTSHTAKTDFEI